ncbi:MAG: transcriptional repressor NrdR [Candidatus Sumerlaeia bacterium]|nr:transcriptional repressor NrdR [Candidatus Sumerlaeia bacterium]
MICPKCGSPNNRVVNSRDAQNGTAVRRRRECLTCGERFTTFETVEEVAVLVTKRSGKREGYDRTKILRGVETACRKRPVTDEQIHDIVGRVEQTLSTRASKEITSREIGELVLAELRQTDEVAYIRFASVYRPFEDVNEFLAELRGLIEGRAAKTKR